MFKSIKWRWLVKRRGGDTTRTNLTIKLNSAKVSGEGANSVDLSKIVVALIDTDESVSYFKKLASDETEYQPFITSTEDKNALSGEAHEFNVIAASTNAEKTVLQFKYVRSAAAAAEKITLTDVDMEVTYKGKKVTFPATIDFNLNEYGDKFDNAGSGNDNLKDYAADIPLNTKIY